MSIWGKEFDSAGVKSGKEDRELADYILQVNDETNKQVVEGNLAMTTENGLSNGGVYKTY